MKRTQLRCYGTDAYGRPAGALSVDGEVVATHWMLSRGRRAAMIPISQLTRHSAARLFENALLTLDEGDEA